MADDINFVAGEVTSVQADEITLAAEFPPGDAETLTQVAGTTATQDYDLTGVDSFAIINGAIFTDAQNVGSGTGGYNTFLALRDEAGSEDPQNVFQIGFNSDDTNPLNSTNDELDVEKTHTVLLSSMVQVTIDGVAYYQIRLDLNESNSDILTSIDQFKIYSSTSQTIESTTVLEAQRLIYDMDAGTDVDVLLKDVSSGGGTDDYAFLIPVSNFVDAQGNPLNPTTTYIYLYVQMGAAGGEYDAEGGFEEFNLQNGVTLSGHKFEDLNGNGILESGEGPIAAVAAHQGLVDPDHRQRLEQPGSVQWPGVERLEPEVGEQGGDRPLGILVVAGHEHHRRMGEARSVLHNLGPDLVQRLDHARLRDLPRKRLGCGVCEPQGQVGAMIGARNGIGGVDENLARERPHF